MDRAGLAGGPVVPFAEDVAEEDLSRVHALVDAIIQTEGQLKTEVV